MASSKRAAREATASKESHIPLCCKQFPLDPTLERTYDY